MNRSMLDAMHRNLLHGATAVSDAIPEAVSCCVGGWQLIDSGLGDLNINTAFVLTQSGEGPARLEEIEAWFQARKAPFSLHLREWADRRAAREAASRGYRLVQRQAAMLLDAPPICGPLPSGLQIIRVEDEEGLDAYVDAESEEPARMAAHREADGELVNVVLTIPGIRLFVGLADGRPVARSMVVVSDGVAGIANVYVAPSVRRTGIGRAITDRAIADGVALGATAARLEPSIMGRPLYEEMGFREVGTYLRFSPPSESPARTSESPVPEGGRDRR